MPGIFGSEIGEADCGASGDALGAGAAGALYSVTLPRACACAAWYDWWTDAGMPGIEGNEIGVCLVLGGEADCGAFGDALRAGAGATGAAAATAPCGGGT